MRVNCQSWEDARVILADEALQVVAFGKSLVMTRTNLPAEYLNIDPSGLADGRLRAVNEIGGNVTGVTGRVTCDGRTDAYT